MYFEVQELRMPYQLNAQIRLETDKRFNEKKLWLLPSDARAE